jgi:hypothetical protein
LEGISLAVMIAGNPKAGRTMATCALALLLAMILITAFVAFRKRTAPVKEPPLHPSTLITELSEKPREGKLAAGVWRDLPQQRERFCGIGQGTFLGADTRFSGGRIGSLHDGSSVS